jgi:acetyltransferase-like isoleucine patch superfamily enzyme
LNGIRFTSDCKFFGQPVVRLAPGACIELGRNVLVNSRYDSNVAGLPFPTILAATEPMSRITIGDDTGISGASLVARNAITVGKRVMIGAGACIWDTDFHPLNPEKRREHQTRDAKSAPISIGDDVFIGARALILKGVTVGGRAVIGAGAVVTRDVEPGAIVVGNPARVIGSV